MPDPTAPEQAPDTNPIDAYDEAVNHINALVRDGRIGSVEADYLRITTAVAISQGQTPPTLPPLATTDAPEGTGSAE